MWRRIGIYLVGLGITALGISLVILSKAGAGPWDTIAVGLNKHFGLTIGNWSIIAQAVVVLFTAIIERKRPQWESIAAIMIRSWILDAWIYVVFRNINFSSTWAIQWLSYATGVMATGVGIGIYLLAKFPKTPIDGFMIALHDRFGWSLTISRSIIESSAAVLGFLLGGPVGLGTLLIAFTLGRIIQISNGSVKKIIHPEKVVLTKS